MARLIDIILADPDWKWTKIGKNYLCPEILLHPAPTLVLEILKTHEYWKARLAQSPMFSSKYKSIQNALLPPPSSRQFLTAEPHLFRVATQRSTCDDPKV
jgi:hypothetical protein